MRTAAIVAATAGIQGVDAAVGNNNEWMTTFTYEDPADCKDRKTRPPRKGLSIFAHPNVVATYAAQVGSIAVASNKFVNYEHANTCTLDSLNGATNLGTAVKGATQTAAGAFSNVQLKFDECFDAAVAYADAAGDAHLAAATANVNIACGIGQQANPYVGTVVIVSDAAANPGADEKAPIFPFVLHSDDPEVNQNACFPGHYVVSPTILRNGPHWAVKTCAAGVAPTFAKFPTYKDCIVGTNQTGSTAALTGVTAAAFDVAPHGWMMGVEDTVLNTINAVYVAKAHATTAGEYLGVGKSSIIFCPTTKTAYATPAPTVAEATTCASSGVRSSAAAGLFAAAAWLLF